MICHACHATLGCFQPDATTAVLHILLDDVRRNYGLFWFAWVTRDGLDYLLCGEDYQGYNVIDLAGGRNVLTFPEAAYKGGGFCWTAVHPSPSGRTLAVEGCYWACPYELVFYDLPEPTRSPLPELGRVQDLYDIKGWTGEHQFLYRAGEEQIEAGS